MTEAKCLVLGDSNCGKTAIVGRFCFDDMATLEPDLALRPLQKAVPYYNNARKRQGDMVEVVALTIIDTAGG